MDNHILNFYNNLTAPEQKAQIMHFINAAAKEIISSYSFNNLEENIRSDLTGTDSRAKIDAIVKCSIEAGKQMVKLDSEKHILLVNNKSDSINRFALFMIECVQRNVVKSGKIELTLCNNECSGSYSAVINSLNSMFGYERIKQIPSPSQIIVERSVGRISVNENANEQNNTALPRNKILSIKDRLSLTKSQKLISLFAVGLAVIVAVVCIAVGSAAKSGKAKAEQTTTTDELIYEYEDEENSKDISVTANGASEVIEEYEIVSSASNFVKGKAWVEYKIKDDSYHEWTYYALINKSGEILYSVCENTLKENSDFAGNGATTTVFDNGTAAYYGEYWSGLSKGPSTGFVLLDENGKISYRSDDNDDTTEYYFFDYCEGKYLLKKHKANFSSSNDSAIIIDYNGNVLDSINGSFSNGQYIGNGYIQFYDFRNNGYENECIYNFVSKRKISGNLIRSQSFSFFKTYNDYSVLEGPVSYKNGYLYFPFSELTNNTSLDNNGNLYKTVESDEFGDDGIITKKVGDGKYEFYTLSDELLCISPDFPNTYIKRCGTFSGGYCAIVITGQDEKEYLVVIDKTGKTLYDPLKIECDEKEHKTFNYSDYSQIVKNQYKGYVQICDHKAVTPEGKVIDSDALPDDVLSRFKGAVDGLVRVYNDNTKTYTYEDIHGNTVINRIKQTSSTTIEGKPITESTTAPITTYATANAHSYSRVSNFSIIGKWKSVGSYGFGQAQPGAIVVFNGVNCNFYSPNDTYALTQSGDYYTLECKNFLFGDTVTFTVKTIDNDHIDIYYGSNVTELVRTQ